MKLKKRQLWMLLFTAFLWGILIVRYPYMADSIAIQIDPNGIVGSAINKNVLIFITILLTTLANYYTFRKYNKKSDEIALSFLIPYTLFLFCMGCFTFFAV